MAQMCHGVLPFRETEDVWFGQYMRYMQLIGVIV
jgi:hypothetical protein